MNAELATVIGIEHHLILRPAVVQCDVCRVQYKTHAFHRWQNEAARQRMLAALREEGWAADGARQVCPDCVRADEGSNQ